MKRIKEILVGKKIVGIRNLNKDEMEMFGWYKNPMVIVLDDKSQIVLQADDEGNDGGAAFLHTPTEQHIMYTTQ
jgi:hypothetical protein